MAKKLPKIITQEEFEKLFEEATKLEKKTKSKDKKLRIRKYRVAMLLGFEAGMRISEIVGLEEQRSKCCNAPIIKTKNGKEKTNNKM